jgi:hypothetical protein
MPSVNQMEVHPWWHDDALIPMHRSFGIIGNGYAPFAAPDFIGSKWNVSIKADATLTKVCHGVRVQVLALVESCAAHPVRIFPPVLPDCDRDGNVQLASVASVAAPEGVAGQPTERNCFASNRRPCCGDRVVRPTHRGADEPDRCHPRSPARCTRAESMPRSNPTKVNMLIANVPDVRVELCARNTNCVCLTLLMMNTPKGRPTLSLVFHPSDLQPRSSLVGIIWSKETSSNEAKLFGEL